MSMFPINNIGTCNTCTGLGVATRKAKASSTPSHPASMKEVGCTTLDASFFMD